MTPQQQAYIVQRTAEGLPGCTIAQSIGVHPSTITRTQNIPDIRTRIEAIRSRVIDQAADQAADNIIHAITAYKAKDSDTQLREHGYKASHTMLQAIGILPSTNTSIMIQQVINQHTQEIHLEPAAAAALKHLGIDEGPVIDV